MCSISIIVSINQFIFSLKKKKKERIYVNKIFVTILMLLIVYDEIKIVDL